MAVTGDGGDDSGAMRVPIATEAGVWVGFLPDNRPGLGLGSGSGLGLGLGLGLGVRSGSGLVLGLAAAPVASTAEAPPGRACARARMPSSQRRVSA